MGLAEVVPARAYFTDSVELQLDYLLNEVCVAIQLSRSLYDKALAEFRRVGVHLQNGGPLSRWNPDISPQGSFETRTTVQPLRHTEYDIDLLCQLLQGDRRHFVPPAKLLQETRTWIAEHPQLSKLLSKRPPARCVRLEYPRQFHLDIVPACPDHESGDGWIYVPDRTLQEWRRNNPRKLVAWFDAEANRLLEAKIMLKAMVLPVEWEPMEVKPPLKRVVQLLKRWRDKQYQHDDELAPSSIVLMTIAANRYEGQRSIGTTLADILARLVVDLERPGHFDVYSPVDNENLTEKWRRNPDILAAFKSRIVAFYSAWMEVKKGGGIPRIGPVLKDLFGEEPVGVALKAQAQLIEHDRHRGSLAASRSTGRLRIGPAAGALAIPRNTFHGD